MPIVDAFAQSQGSPSSSNPTISMLLTLLQFVPILLIVYLLILRPQRQRQKQLDKMLKELKKGDRVLTQGGIFGTVVGLDDSKAVLSIAEGTKVEFSKGSIVQVLTGDGK